VLALIPASNHSGGLSLRGRRLLAGGDTAELREKACWRCSSTTRGACNCSGSKAPGLVEKD